MTDQIANAIKVTVSTGYDASATSIILATGEGAELPDPSGDNYNMVWWDASTYPDPADDPNFEIVRVTAKSTDTITVTRNQEGSGASTKNTGGSTYKMFIGPTAKTITDLQAEIDSDIGTHAGLPNAHHNESHSVASHFDTTVTGAELDADHTKLGNIEDNAKDDQTGAEIKTLYQAEANAYTDTKNTKLAGVEESADVTDPVNVASSIHGVASKSTPVNADEIGLIDSNAANVLKKLTWANLKATLKTYFDTLYNLYSHPNHTGDVTSAGDGATTIANDAVDIAMLSATGTPSSSTYLRGDNAWAAPSGVPSGVIAMWHGLISAIPSGWYLCNGENSTPDLRSKFLRGAPNATEAGGTGGADTHTLTTNEMPSHRHGYDYTQTVPGAGGYVAHGQGYVGHDNGHDLVGGGAAHNNMPAYYQILFIMKS